MTLQADLVMSILVPAEAMGVARKVADAMRAAGASRPFADCNAVSPRSASEMASIISAAGGDYIDGGIIGGSPAKGAVPRIYTSGPRAGLMDELDGKGIAVRNLGPGIDRASGMKMCYASMTKGTNALRVAMLTAADSLGLYDELIEELAYSQGEALSAMESQIPGLPANAGRWIGEMEEIAATFAAAGVTPGFPRGRGGDIQAAGLHTVCKRESGDHRPRQDPKGHDQGDRVAASRESRGTRLSTIAR